MYLKIKNAIISLLLMIMYCGWTVDGIKPITLAIACVGVFISIFVLLESADETYREARRRQK